MLDQQIKAKLVEGLALWQTYVPKERIVPFLGRTVPQKPYIVYSIDQAWQHPGLAVFHNPPPEAYETLEPVGQPIASGTVSDMDSSPYILIDTTKDFFALGVTTTDEVVVGNKKSCVLRVRTSDRIELFDPIVTQRNSTYTIRKQNVRVHYMKSGLRAITLRIVAASPAEADEIGHKILDFFILPSGAHDTFYPLGWTVRSIGNLTVADVVESSQVVERVRILKTVLHGKEIISEVRQPVAAMDYPVENAPLTYRDPRAPETVPNSWRLYEPPLEEPMLMIP